MEENINLDEITDIKEIKVHIADEALRQIDLGAESRNIQQQLQVSSNILERLRNRLNELQERAKKK